LFHSFLEFNVGKGERVYFANPVGIENILTRVTGNNVSEIGGTLGVDGGANLFLLNPNGIIFGEGAELDIGGSFVGSTANSIVFGDEEFSASEPEAAPLLKINVPIGLQYGPNQPAPVVNAGTLEVGQGQGLTLTGGTVVNTDTGELIAPGGQISLTAVPSESVINLDGTGQVSSVDLPDDTSQVVSSAPALAALLEGAGLAEAGIPVEVNPGTAIVSGSVDVSNIEGEGGIVQVLGDKVELLDAKINASGRDGGGMVLIGGDYQGRGTVPNASQTYLSGDSVVNADGLQNGDGGQVIVWADKTASIHGSLTARGGAVSGNGGLIETSGKQFLNLTSTPDASALNGSGGIWLIDPTDITIMNGGGGAIGTNAVDVANINAALNMGTSVTITTSIGGAAQGNITQNNDAPIRKTAGGDATLKLQAENDIFLNADITSDSGQLNVELLADSDENSTGSIRISDARINTNGGNFWGFATENDPNDWGVNIGNSSINTEGGDIEFTGTGGTVSGTNNRAGTGIFLGNSVLATTGTGNITLTGNGGTNGDFGIGIDLIDNTIVSSENGDIWLIGTGNGVNNGWGIQVRDGTLVRTTGTGNVSLTGTSNGTGEDNYGILIREQVGGGLSVVETIGTGNINLTGTGNGTGSGNIGIFINSGSVVQSRGTGAITLEGRSGAGISGNQGIRIDGQDSRVSAGNGNITLRGTAAPSNGDLNHGIHILNKGLVQSSGAGSIEMVGTTDASSDSEFGNDGISIVLGGGVESTATGSITLTGTGGNGIVSNQGIVFVDPDSRVTAVDGNIFLKGTSRGTGTGHYGIWLGARGGGLAQTTGTGNITLEGIIGGIGNNSEGIFFGNGGVVEATETGNINLTADEITIAGNLVEIGGRNLLRLQPLDPTLGIAIGGTTTDTRLNLDSSELNILQNGFSQIIIGRDNSSGAIAVLPATFNNPTTIQSPLTGGTITTTGAINTSNSLTLIAGSDVTLNNDINTGSGNLSILGSAITQTSGSLFVNGDAFFTSTSGNVTLNNVGAENLNVHSEGAILGNGILTINNNASFTSNLANAGTVSVRNTTSTNIGYSIIGGNFLLNSPTPISQAIGEPLQVAGTISVNGAGSTPLINTQGLPFINQTLPNGDVVVTKVGTVNLNPQTVSGNLIVNSLPIGVAEFTEIFQPAAITLNQNNSFGGTLRFRTNLDGANTVEAAPNITQNGTQIVNNTTTLNAYGGDILLDDAANQFGSINFSGKNVTLTEQNATNLQQSEASGNFTLTSGGLITQTGRLAITGNADITTTLPQAGTVFFTNTGATLLGNSLIGGNFTINSGSTISQAPQSLLQVAGTTNVDLGTLNFNLDPEDILGRLELPNGDVIITEVGLIELEAETFSSNLTVTSLAERLQFIPGVLYSNPAINLSNDQNLFGGVVRLTTDAPTTVVESGTPSITQNGAIQVNGAASFTAENGNITLEQPTNSFNRLAFNSGDVLINEGNDTNLLSSTATRNLELTSGGAIAQTGSLIAKGNTSFTSLQLNAPINLTSSNQISGAINLSTNGNGDATLVNTLENTQLGLLDIGGNLAVTSGGGISQTSPITITGITSLNAENQDILLPQNNDFSQLTIQGGNQVIINDINDISLDDSRVFGRITVNAGNNITTQNINSLSGLIELISHNGSIDTTAGTLSSSLITGDGGDIILSTQENITIGDIEADGLASGNITFNAEGTVSINNSDIKSLTRGSRMGGEINITADIVEILNGGRIASSTFGSGDAGDVTVTARRVLIQNSQPDSNQITGIGTDTGQFSSGNGGNISIFASESVELIGNQPGSFTPDPTQPGIVLDVANNTSTGITTATFGSGDAGKLNLNTEQLIVRDGAGITTSSGIFLGDAGDGGELRVNATTIELQGKAGLATATLGSGNAGDLIVEAEQITLRDGAIISADTFGSGRAGDLEITTNQLTILDGSRVGAATVASGAGGTVRITASDKLELAGTSADGQVSSGIFANSTGSGSTGNLELHTGELIVRDGAKVSVSSTGSAQQAGSLNINAGSILLSNQGILEAITTSGNGGNITLRLLESLIMRHGSKISTTAGTAQAGGDGGNITIYNSNGFIIGVPNEDSDISANAFTGNGGRINITTQGIFGLEFRDKPTPLSDITASSEFGLNGTVEINQLNIDPSQGLSNLPDEPGTPQPLQGCRGGGIQSGGQFISIGRQGLPTNPYESLDSSDIWEDLQPASPLDENPTQPPEQIVEATGWVVTEEGEVILVAQMPPVASRVGCLR
ncbi:MAG: filamentous hemagglutinin N-terminal domain-containing protein, partial [Symploca sp. SIO1A3]|nr:filamentous hemagglutinin N-terminal domain-containing protein [Symploca sp. SIO1A3]